MDPLTTLLTKYISNPARRPQRDLTGEWTKTDFHTLVVCRSRIECPTRKMTRIIWHKTERPDFLDAQNRYSWRSAQSRPHEPIKFQSGPRSDRFIAGTDVGPDRTGPDWTVATLRATHASRLLVNYIRQGAFPNSCRSRSRFWDTKTKVRTLLSFVFKQSTYYESQPLLITVPNPRDSTRR